MRIKNPSYLPGNLADTLLEDGEALEGEYNYSMTMLPQIHSIRFRFHNPSTAAKTIRDNFKYYFINEGVVDWQWKYC